MVVVVIVIVRVVFGEERGKYRWQLGDVVSDELHGVIGRIRAHRCFW